MTGKKMTIAAALTAGLLAAAPPALARDAKIEILRGQPAATAVSVAADEGGSGVTVHRGAPVAAASPATAQQALSAGPVAFISGQRIRPDALEPAGEWFIDRSQEDLVLVHCYTRHSALVGGGRRILCDARRF